MNVLNCPHIRHVANSFLYQLFQVPNECIGAARSGSAFSSAFVTDIEPQNSDASLRTLGSSEA